MKLTDEDDISRIYKVDLDNIKIKVLKPKKPSWFMRFKIRFLFRHRKHKLSDDSFLINIEEVESFKFNKNKKLEELK